MEFDKRFMEWFKGSKVIGKDKKPLPVYHGTTEDFEVFQTNPLEKSTVYGIGVNAIGASFTEDFMIATHYPSRLRRGESRKVIKAFLSIKNPKRYRTVYAVQKDMIEFYEENGIEFLHALGDTRSILENVVLFKQHLIDSGYDGLTYLEGPPYNTKKNKARVWVAFYPEQIKIVGVEVI